MRRRHRLPTQWLFTDERQGDGLWAALERVPRGGGVVLRHYRAADRAEIAARVRRVCRRRGLLFVVAGPPRLARAWRADGTHGRLRGALTAPAHGVVELVAARRRGARLAFLSPLFATRSHPGSRALGRLRFGLIARGRGIDVAALGGVLRARWRTLGAIGAAGFGAIDGWEERPRPRVGDRDGAEGVATFRGGRSASRQSLGAAREQLGGIPR